MNRETYKLIETYMLSCMEDSAHDKEHIYRVLNHAMEIAKSEKNVAYDVLISACLLHDIGRKEQFENSSVCHAAVGGEKAYHFLLSHGFSDQFSESVKQCIMTHRYRKNHLPQSIEAKILFDADKLDVTGAIGIARTLLYHGEMGERLYMVLPDGTISDGTDDSEETFFKEYKHKLENLYSKFFTKRGAELAAGRKKAAKEFYEHLYAEIRDSHMYGQDELSSLLQLQDTDYKSRNIRSNQ